MRRPLLIPALIAILLYAITVPGTLIYDDRALVEEDARLKSVGQWGRFFTESYNGGIDNLYRPIVSMTYAVQHAIHGTTAWPYHLVNVLLHAIVTAMVAGFAIALCRRGGAASSVADRVGLIAGLLFAAHPVHVEAVAGIVGRAELLCAIGSVGLLWICVSDRPLTTRRVLAAWGLYLLALFSKEQAMLLPLVAIALMAALRVEREKRLSKLFAIVAGTLAAYVVLREQVLGLKLWWERVFLDPWIQPLVQAEGIDRWTATLAIAGRYLILLFAPYRLHLDYGGPITPTAWDAREPLFWLGIVAVLLWIGWMIVAWRRKDRVSIAMLLAFAIVYGSIGNLATIIGVNVAERLMYLPSAFIVILIALPLATLRWRRVAWSMLGILLVLGSLRTITYAARWNDRLTLYTYLANQDPRSMQALLLVATEGIKRGQPELAIDFATRATVVSPKNEVTFYWLGRAYESAGNIEWALDAWACGEAVRPGGQCAQARAEVTRVSNE